MEVGDDLHRPIRKQLEDILLDECLPDSFELFELEYPVARSKSNHQTERSGLNLDSISRVGETMEWFLIEMAESADKSARLVELLSENTAA
ncbi:hypothetical protein [Halococcus thailandensis]|uniref:Uncharacterized protein n=1 Tax=Halococcus thailandensis JCM 13552 TaxID=1227457 RepID=M0NHW4_9EURY|nr:hypothetical protein [Halococcus thailandensis]EMA56704.1 hypothetical protein C451_00940 [Halococcus thailandensis JCM 13552]